MSLRHESDDEERFRSFAAAAAVPLGRLAYLLCGDRHLAQDLVQTCLIKMYRVWPRIEQPDAVDAYVRQVLLRCWLNERRKPWRRVESRTGVVPDLPVAASDPAQGVGPRHLKELLRLALAEIPPRQRAAVVLRHWMALSVTETAAALRCSEGTVKSQTARGLTALRAVMTRQAADDGVRSWEMSSS